MQHSPELYISSSSLPPWQCALDAFLQLNCGIELSGSFASKSELLKTVSYARQHSIALLAHNYFYPVADAFVINLADPEPVNRRRSLDYVITAIDFCQEHGIATYSVHSGFACSPDINALGGNFADLPHSSMHSAYTCFQQSLTKACQHALQSKMMVLIENNVLTKSNLSQGVNRHCLCVNSLDILKLLKELAIPNLSLLLDLGHLKISAATLGLSPQAEFHALKSFTGQIHMHDNNGMTDQHLACQTTSWFWRGLQPFAGPLILEQPKADYQALIDQIHFSRKLLTYA